MPKLNYDIEQYDALHHFPYEKKRTFDLRLYRYFGLWYRVYFDFV